MSHDWAAFLDAPKGNRHEKTHQASISQQVLSVWQSILLTLSFYYQFFTLQFCYGCCFQRPREGPNAVALGNAASQFSFALWRARHNFLPSQAFEALGTQTRHSQALEGCM